MRSLERDLRGMVIADCPLNHDGAVVRTGDGMRETSY
jgi:hypothetical protein